MKLSAEKQSIIRRIIGGDISVPYDGCLSQGCLDKKTTWVVDTAWSEPSVPVSQCARCNLPKAFGRTVRSTCDVLRPLMTRDVLAGKCARSHY